MPHAERIPFSWAGGGSWVKHVAVVVVASMVHCRDQHSVFVSHLGEKVESCCKELPLPLLIHLPRLLHLLCAGSHPFFTCDSYNYDCSRICCCISLLFPMRTFLSEVVYFILHVWKKRLGFFSVSVNWIVSILWRPFLLGSAIARNKFPTVLGINILDISYKGFLYLQFKKKISM